MLNSEEAGQEADNNRILLHITKAEIDLPVGTDEHSQEVYDKVIENFNLFKAKNGEKKMMKAGYLCNHEW